MAKIRKLDIDNTGGYKRRQKRWLVRYKSISGYSVRHVVRVSPEEAARREAEAKKAARAKKAAEARAAKAAARAAARREAGEKAARERKNRLADTQSVERTIVQAQRRAAGSKAVMPPHGGVHTAKHRRPGLLKRIGDADWVVIGICLFVVFSVVFLYNAFRGNRAVSASTAEDIRENITYIETTQTASPEEIEESVNRLEELSHPAADTGETPQAKYMRLMSDSVVVGDSLTEGLTVYGWLSDGQVFSEIGASLIGSGDMFKKAAALHPKNAFFAFGMNDMGNYGKDPSGFIKRYNELLDEFVKDSPKTRIFICSISVPTEGAIRGNRSIGYYKEYNEALKKMAADRNVTWVDSTSIFIEHPELYAGDGIHAQPSYYPYWLDNMIKATTVKPGAGKDAKDKAAKDSKDKNSTDSKDSKDSKDNKDSKEKQDNQDSKDNKDDKTDKETKDD